MNPFKSPAILLVLILLAFLLFGANKLPKMARNMGQSMRILKSEVKEMKSDGKTNSEEKSATEDDSDTVEGTVISNGENTADQNPKEQSSK